MGRVVGAVVVATACFAIFVARPACASPIVTMLTNAPQDPVPDPVPLRGSKLEKGSNPLPSSVYEKRDDSFMGQVKGGMAQVLGKVQARTHQFGVPNLTPEEIVQQEEEQGQEQDQGGLGSDEPAHPPTPSQETQQPQEGKEASNNDDKNPLEASLANLGLEPEDFSADVYLTRSERRSSSSTGSSLSSHTSSGSMAFADLWTATQSVSSGNLMDSSRPVEQQGREGEISLPNPAFSESYGSLDERDTSSHELEKLVINGRAPYASQASSTSSFASSLHGSGVGYAYNDEIKQAIKD